MQDQDKVKEVKEYTYPNAKVRVVIPDLTEEEYEKRFNQLKATAIEYCKQCLQDGVDITAQATTKIKSN